MWRCRPGQGFFDSASRFASKSAGCAQNDIRKRRLLQEEPPPRSAMTLGEIFSARSACSAVTSGPLGGEICPARTYTAQPGTLAWFFSQNFFHSFGNVCILRL